VQFAYRDRGILTASELVGEKRAGELSISSADSGVRVCGEMPARGPGASGCRHRLVLEGPNRKSRIIRRTDDISDVLSERTSFYEIENAAVWMVMAVRLGSLLELTRLLCSNPSDQCLCAAQ